MRDSIEEFFDAVKEHEKVIWIVLASVLGTALICFLIFGVACRGYNSDPDAIKVGLKSQDLISTPYEEVVDILEEKGFTNIKTIEVDGYFFTTSGAISKITIDGNKNFFKYSKFSPNDLILIYYYE